MCRRSRGSPCWARRGRSIRQAPTSQLPKLRISSDYRRPKCCSPFPISCCFALCHARHATSAASRAPTPSHLTSCARRPAFSHREKVIVLFLSLKHRSFALLWSGQTISRLGDSLYRVALAWWVLEKTGSATAMGTVLICSMTPMLIFLLLGGVAVDRLPRLRLMIGSDVLRGIVAGA